MKSFTNPIIPLDAERPTADPYILRRGDRYYYCFNKCTGEKIGIYLLEMEDFTEIYTKEAHLVVPCPESGTGSLPFAPELHFIDGAWYIYTAPEGAEGGHGMRVFRNTNASPLSEFEDMGYVEGIDTKWSIDGTFFEFDGRKFFIWTGWGAKLRLCEMENPCKLKGESIVIGEPTYDFEKKVGLINEGPAVLKRGGKLHVVYSANDSRSDEYCLGRITFSGGDIMNPENWIKYDKAIFEKTEDIFGPGHCSFTTETADGKEIDYIVYHANIESGSGWYGRSCWIQTFTWDKDDNPVFGKPHR